MSPVKAKNPENEQKTQDCLAILNSLRDDLGSQTKVAKRLGVNKVTVGRWFKTGVIRECYLTLIPYLASDEKLIETPAYNLIDRKNAFAVLNEWYERTKSWSVVGNKVGASKRTLMRWNKTGKIGKEFLKLIFYLKQKENLLNPSSPLPRP